jgi:quercetin dioxygenase-like cupin family protein
MGGSMQEKRPFWLDMDGGDTVQFLDQVYRMKASGAQTGGLFGLVEVSTPQGSGPPPHVHEREDEAFYVLEGSYEVTVGNDRFDAREGWFIFVPRGVPHGYVVRAAPARHLGFRIPQRMGDVLPRRGPGDGRSGSGSGHARGVGEGARRHVARPAACSVSA